MRGTFLGATAGVALLAASAFGDGMVLGAPLSAGSHGKPRETAVDPVIPDQRALIVHRNGAETLVIETAFSGEGSDFAWVVPTPSVPRLAAASPELFPALADAVRPSLVSEVPDLRVAGSLGVGVWLVLLYGGRKARRAGAGLIVALASFGFVAERGSASPNDADAGASGGSGLRSLLTPQEEFVSVKQREVVAGFDAVTLTARSADALTGWLRANGYAVPDGLERVADGYVRDGWVFTAMRLHKEESSAAVRIRPMAFSFPAASPVYPMRLTGLRGTPVTVDLFVAGEARAAAGGFDVLRCAYLDSDGRHESGVDRIVLGGDEVRPWIERAAVLTHARRAFAPGEMDSDVGIGWSKFDDEQRIVFSTSAAAAFAGNAGILVAIGALVAATSAASSRRPRARSTPRRPAQVVGILVSAISVALAVHLATPTAATRPLGHSAGLEERR